VQYAGGRLVFTSASASIFFLAGSGATSVAVDYLIVGAGAGGGFITANNGGSGGGGAGGLITGTAVSVPKGVSLTVTVGAKGNGSTTAAADGGTRFRQFVLYRYGVWRRRRCFK
jgi:hypothetical protein